MTPRARRTPPGLSAGMRRFALSMRNWMYSSIASLVVRHSFPLTLNAGISADRNIREAVRSLTESSNPTSFALSSRYSPFA